MLIEHADARHTRKRVPTWVWVCVGVVLAAIATGSALLITHWPFTRANITRALESASGRPVEIRTFTRSYFPPGCIAEGVRFLRHKHPDGPPLITVEKIEVQGSFAGMISSPKRLAAVRIVGMHMQIPPKKPASEPGNPVLLNSGPGGDALSISKIIADGSLLEFLPSDLAVSLTASKSTGSE